MKKQNTLQVLGGAPLGALTLLLALAGFFASCDDGYQPNVKDIILYKDSIKPKNIINKDHPLKVDNSQTTLYIKCVPSTLKEISIEVTYSDKLDVDASFIIDDIEEHDRLNRIIKVEGINASNSNELYVKAKSGFTSGQITITVGPGDITAICNVTVGGTTQPPNPPGNTNVTFSGVSANGNATTTTNQLTLTFSQAITGLTANDITLTGENGFTSFTKGALTGSGPTYNLGVTPTASGSVSVGVSKTGYTISGSPKTGVSIYYVPGSTPDITFSVTANGNASTTTTSLSLVFSSAVTGLAANDIALTGVSGFTGFTKGNLSGSGTTYTLGITVTGAGSINVGVSKTGISNTTQTVALNYKAPDIQVTFNGLTANGSSSQTTSQLTLTFSQAITGLTVGNITLGGSTGATKGSLSSSGTSWILTITGVNSSGNVTVTLTNPAGYSITPLSQSTDIYYYSAPGTTTVTLDSVTATNGNYTTPTTKLTLTFSAVVSTLTAGDITVNGVGATKGTLEGSGPVYTLNISDVNAIGDVSVTVGNPSGYTISGSPKTATVYGGPFVTATGITDIAVNTTGFITVDTATGVIARDVNNGSDDYGNYLKVTIPTDQLPILASDTIVIKYIGTANAPLTTKKDTSSSGDVNPTDYATWTGNNTEQTKEIKATVYGDSIPTEFLFFQGRPNTTAWKIKITSITVTKGSLIQVTTPISIKPVAAETPVTTLDNLQYSGTVSWSPSDATFAESQVYTATISINTKGGYTFSGISADTFPVTGASSVTHVVGTTSLTISAEFPATAGPPPVKTMSFTAGDLTPIGNATVEDVSGDTYTLNMAGGYGPSAYFKVKFDTDVKLSEYSKLDITFEGLSGDTGYKNARIIVSATAPPSISENGFTFKTAENGARSPNDNTGVTAAKSDTISITPIDASIDLNEIFIAIYFWSGAAKYKISGIKFYN